ncbi:acyltransferase domain-containing protein [Actinoplanes sp. LDG1-06]|uniref:Acyltransferase domain-containing protein n=1 Tax=Paractinoplanes ovalisporus TaxID=2810368 RepID=A0ABS2ALQ6_9ACTN|nr:type I polyketide synthase [Actinoplanes ovalisporus]MBM2620134.1 acyltransferase domain-containing protein [Actinoplanes ovalisporus]
MTEPIAIVGMACRFAGGIDSPEEFWDLLRSGRDVIGEVPPERWAWYAAQSPAYAAAVRDTPAAGAFLDDIAGFDAEFFDLTPREAAQMDPQQRIVLELAWQALEDAGLPPPDLAGTDTGVFMGVGADDYGRRLLEDLPAIEAWTGIGGAYCAVANRVSYHLDLRGPSIAVDTACSSSLVAIHLAAQALRSGECPVALAGGVLVMAAPGLSRVLQAAGATAPDGRSKSFDAEADGYGRGEGGGVVVLKRLRDAERDGDRILAVLRGSAVRQDGRTEGIMAPNGDAQAHLLRRAYATAGVDPATIAYVEAHGTGTRAGDPMEAAAMSAVFGAGRDGPPCLIGSVKPNIGHLEAGAGVAGVIKAVLAMRHGAIPPSLNVTRPTPAVDWATAGLRVSTGLTPWPDGPGPRRCGVSGYGYGGTLAHVILEAAAPQPAPGPDPSGPDPSGAGVFPLSAAGPAALTALAGRLADRLEADPTLRPADVGHTLGVRRAHLRHRAAVAADDRAGLVAGLRRLRATAPAGTGRGIVWVFSGHGSQWTGMARDLIAGQPAAAAVADRLDPVFQQELGASLRTLLAEDREQPVDLVQPMIFAVQMALAGAWESAGVRPDAVIGHSVGEIAAAVTAGVLTLEEGAVLVCRRSVLLRPAIGAGAMAMVNLPGSEVEARLGGRDDVVVAITASPAWTVVSGDTEAVAGLSRRWSDAGVAVRAIDSPVAFHSPQMDPLLDDLVAAAARLNPAAARIPVYSTALDDPRGDDPRDGAYWALNLRGRVHLDRAVAAAAEDGHRVFLEISPHPVVAHSISETLAETPEVYVAVSLRRRKPALPLLRAALAGLYTNGVRIDWDACWPGGRLVDLPGTVWQHRPHWAPEPPVRPAGRPHDPAAHTLLGEHTTIPGAGEIEVWSTEVDLASRPYPGRHPVRGVEIVPAAALLHTLVTAGAEGRPWPDLADVALRVPVSLTHGRELRVVRQDGTLRLATRIDGDDTGWLTHTTALVRPAGGTGDQLVVTGPAIALDPGHVVKRLAELDVTAMGFEWTVQTLAGAPGLLDAVVTTGDPGWAPLLDAVLSTASVIFDGPPVLRMPARLGRLTLAPVAPREARVVVRRTGPETVEAEVADASGAVVARLHDLRYGRLDSDPDAPGGGRDLHVAAWIPLPVTPPAGPGTPVELVGPPSVLRDALRGLRSSTPGHVVVVPPDDPHEAAWLLAETAQRLVAEPESRLWCVTRGVRDGALAHSTLWGLGRVIGGEQPDMWGGVIDIADDADLAAIPAVLDSVRGEDVVAIRGGRPAVARLRAPDDVPRRPAVPIQPDGTYLITGGLGALGRATALRLAGRGARRLVLAGRHGLPPRGRWDDVSDPGLRERIETVRSLEALGAHVVVVEVDVADRAAAARALSAEALGLPPIRGVVHAAGALDNRMLRDLDEESLRAVLRPKADGARVLHELFPPGTTAFFVLFSSAGPLLGLPGQAAYAAANSYLDTLATHRRERGDRGALSIAWTSWRGLGMSTSSEVTDLELAARGAGDIGADEAFAAWERLDRLDTEFAVVLPIRGPSRVPLLSELTPPAAGPLDATGAPAPWAATTGDERRAVLTTVVAERVAAETGLAASDVDVRRPLAEMGLDSLMTTRIRLRLEQEVGVTLPATLLWDRPTVARIAAYAADLLDEATRTAEAADPLDEQGQP